MSEDGMIFKLTSPIYVFVVYDEGDYGIMFRALVIDRDTQDGSLAVYVDFLEEYEYKDAKDLLFATMTDEEFKSELWKAFIDLSECANEKMTNVDKMLRKSLNEIKKNINLKRLDQYDKD